ncbi:type IV toxin-antitoxin system AbiEi family antitoxin domain-containing protein [Pseudonocardia ailaonensis]|uniref:Type IV toxin-antitoxin system AbiEi family antitoxin domain-containing protein n=1 Tax=Pseudonocardia ailaonensis TaxID=367279 RepID=A0ABN2MXR2_9PSEU
MLTREQARGAGLTGEAIDRRLAARHWVPLHPRVYRDSGHRLTDEVRIRAAVLWAGEGAVLSGLAAAWWHGLAPAPAGEVVVIVPRRRGPRSRAGVTVRRRDLDPVDRGVLRAVPVTAAPLTVLEAAVELGAAGPGFLDRALRTRVGFAEVAAALARNRGAAGAASAAILLDGAAVRSEAVTLDLLVRAVRDARVIGWRVHHPALGMVLPLAFPRSRVAVQVEGWARPVDPARIRRELWQEHVLRRAGWTIARVGRHELVADRAGTIRALVGTVAAAGRHGVAAARSGDAAGRAGDAARAATAPRARPAGAAG